VLTAKMASSLDRMAPGRMAINLVTGWNVTEHRMFGGDALLEDMDRYVRAEEFIDVLRGVWTTTPFSYDGQFYKVAAAELLLRPATAAPPDIFTASRSARGLDMVAAKADWWFLDFDKGAAGPDDVLRSLEASIAGMRKRADRLGRRVRYAFNPFVCCAPTAAAARERAERMMKPTEPDADMRKFASRIGPAMKAGGVGTPAEVRAQLGRFRDLGIELLLLKFVPTVAEVEAIAADVVSPMRG
jgi:FMNH2-dependent dimethyl sulfone monooxygenase